MIDGVIQLDLPAGSASEKGSTASMPCYVVGHENALLPPALARLIGDHSDNDGDNGVAAFNPLTLIGPMGSGKSHLVQALMRKWTERLGAANVRYYTAADFGRDYQAAYADGELSTWRRSVRKLRMIVVEDLENLRPRPTIQQELNNAIDALTDADATVVVTAQQEPTQLRTIDAGLCDRLAAGLTVRIHPPAVAARRQLLSLAAHQTAMAASPEQITALANRVDGPASRVLSAVAELEASPTSKRSNDRQVDKSSSLKEIIAITARYFGVTQTALSGPQRRKSLVLARGMVVQMARSLAGLSYAKIGRGLGGRDHSTMMHAHRKIKQQLVNDPNILAAYDELQRIVQAQ